MIVRYIQDSAIDEVPPPRHWEIPRTPVRVVEHVQLRLATVPAHSGGGISSPIQRTPMRIKTPAHPLAHSNKASARPSERTPTVGKGRECEGRKTVIQSIEDDKTAQEEESDGCDEVTVTVSPPISISRGELYCHTYFKHCTQQGSVSYRIIVFKISRWRT